MRPFTHTIAGDATGAVRTAQAALDAAIAAVTRFGGARGLADANEAPVQFLAGGTTLVDLMKLDVMRPARLVDITRISTPQMRSIELLPQGLRIGALATMRQVADHPGVLRHYPVLAQSLQLAASQQIRNMARVGGNVLQRTRCAYFRDTSWPCNKRTPGAGCAALEGENRWHAVLGASDACIASYPGDWATALIALEATVQTLQPAGPRSIPLAQLHRLPGSTPHLETTLMPGELITGFTVPAGPYTRRSLYLKVRDRESYEFALASAAVALELDGETVRQVRIGIGGPVAVPWRAHEAEALLTSQPLTESTATAAARAAFAAARPRQHNAFRIPLGQQTLVRALLQAKTMELAT